MWDGCYATGDVPKPYILTSFNQQKKKKNTDAQTSELDTTPGHLVLDPEIMCGNRWYEIEKCANAVPVILGRT
jgi:hypothetical protein